MDATSRLSSVRSGLSLLLAAWAIHVGLVLVNTIVNRLLILGASSSFDVFMVLSRVFQLAFTGVTVLMIVGASRLGGLRVEVRPPALRDPYRAASGPTFAVDPANERLSRLLLGALVADLVLDAVSLGMSVVIGARTSGGESASERVERLVWLLSIATNLAARGALVAWGARVGRAIGARIPAAIRLGLPAAFGAQAVYYAARLFSPATFRGVSWLVWVATGVSLTISIGFILLLRELLEAARAFKGEDRAEGRAPDAFGAREAWTAAAGGLDRYHGALKARIFAMVGGAVLLALAGAARSPDLAKGIMVLLPLASLGIGVLLALGLYAYARVPAPGAGEAAMVALALMVLAAVVDLYAFALVLDLFGDRFSASRDAMSALPYAQGAGTALSIAHLVALLVSVRRAAADLGRDDLAARAGGLAALWVGLLLFGAVVQIGLVAMKAPEVALLLGLPLLVGAIVALVRHLALIRELAAAMAGRADDPAKDFFRSV